MRPFARPHGETLLARLREEGTWSRRSAGHPGRTSTPARRAARPKRPVERRERQSPRQALLRGTVGRYYEYASKTEQ